MVGSLGAITWTHIRSLSAKVVALANEKDAGTETDGVAIGLITFTVAVEPSWLAPASVWPFQSFTVRAAVRAAGRSARMCPMPPPLAADVAVLVPVFPAVAWRTSAVSPETIVPVPLAGAWRSLRSSILARSPGAAKLPRVVNGFASPAHRPCSTQ